MPTTPPLQPNQVDMPATTPHQPNQVEMLAIPPLQSGQVDELIELEIPEDILDFIDIPEKGLSDFDVWAHSMLDYPWQHDYSYILDINKQYLQRQLLLH